ncbi:hypothetical protein CYY_010165 [Polysphondylium violaceum]|uniref:Transmembrane protein n=1 Tax=Polysphondylium violaceum TaxID=133409 RepID=A0A8J4PLT2_9MYCE|nr:hypothetical protein CYY_010165 [Polysphondylium violaceum]
MKFLYFVLAFVAFVTIFNSMAGVADAHSAAGKGNITYCTMCNTSANCDPKSNHSCSELVLGVCQKINNKCQGTFSYGILTQTNQTISTTIYNDDACKSLNDTTKVPEKNCFTCYNDLQILCYESHEDSHGNSASNVLPGALFTLMASLLAILFKFIN